MTLLLKETTEQLILRVADRLEPEIRVAFLNAVEAAKKSIPVNRLTELLEDGNITGALEAVNIKLTPEQLRPIEDAITKATVSTAKVTATEFGMNFSLIQPHAVRFAMEQAGKLIVGIDSETRQAVADIVTRGVREGVAPRQQARLIREIVGLTRRDAAAVDRFLHGAIESGMRGPQARGRAERMARRLLNRRAENIARTETIHASNMGTQISWESAQDAGLLPPGTQKVWIATEDSRTCPICAVLDGQVVDLGERFDVQEQATSFEIDGTTIRVRDTEPLRRPTTTRTPPAHPSCRCTMGVTLT